jgi:hypothetical protein
VVVVPLAGSGALQPAAQRQGNLANGTARLWSLGLESGPLGIERVHRCSVVLWQSISALQPQSDGCKWKKSLHCPSSTFFSLQQRSPIGRAHGVRTQAGDLWLRVAGPTSRSHERVGPAWTGQGHRWNFAHPTGRQDRQVVPVGQKYRQTVILVAQWDQSFLETYIEKTIQDPRLQKSSNKKGFV